MAADDAARHVLYEQFAELLGTEGAGTLMALLPPIPWHDFATKRDLDALEARLLGEIAELRGELRSEIGAVRSEIGAVRSEIGGVRGEVAGQTRTIVLSNVVAVLATGAMVLAAVNLS